jgi:AAA domain/Primase C terminal 1 (PriCT-1)
MTYKICFSLGTSNYDNCPSQLVAASVKEFFDHLVSDQSTKKGMRYICGPMSAGPHDKPLEYPGEKTWRLKRLALPRRFLAFDIDHCNDPTDFERLREYFSRWQSCFYTTASSMPEAPRARGIVILSAETSPSECESLGVILEKEIKASIGNVFHFDPSVYRASQPIYTPLVNADFWSFDGLPVQVADYASIIKVPPHSVRDVTVRPEGHGTIPVGSRNSTVLSQVGKWRRLGLTESEVLTLAKEFNQTCTDEPLGLGEVEDICSRYAHQSTALAPSGPSEDTWLTSGKRVIPRVAPPPRRYVFGHTITPGTLAVLGGSGGASKTMLAMQICASAACAKSIGEIQVAEGSSLLLLGEEDDAERDRRLGGICHHFALDVNKVMDRVLCIGAAGIDIRLTQQIESNTHPTGLGDRIVDLATDHANDCGVPLQFIVIDHARLVLGGDPNNAEDVTQLTRVLTNIARQTGAAVLLIAHSPKSVLSKAGYEINAADIAGSSAFVDNGRTAFMAYGMREEEAKKHYVPESERHNWVRVQNVKANYAQSGLGWWFKRMVVPGWDIAVLEQQILATTMDFTSNKRAVLQRKIIDHLRVYPGASKRAMRDRAGRKGVFGVSDRELMAEIEKMLESELLTARAPTPEERRTWKLNGQVREVLVSNAPC